MMSADGLVLAAYFSCMGLLAIYGLHRLLLTLAYLRRTGKPHPSPLTGDALPVLTVQVPLYNELYVAARVVDAVCALDYPQHLLEIQILDDSDDATQDLCARKVQEYRARGFRIHHLRRTARAGFKAGALEEGLKRARGEFVAIFDADFLPAPDFVRRVLPCFDDPRIGMVQARWGHLNRDYSALTRVQSIFLDGHFLIEQAARCLTGRFFNFNGTAGIWRRACIESSGGWQPDTLTEDLDLSYRAQMAGWRFHFLPDVVVPAELPVDMNAFKSQQHRWAKGSIQTGLKLLPAILRSRLPAAIKSEAVFHLSGNAAYLLMLAASLLYFPVMRIRERMEWSRLMALDLPILLLGSGSVLAFYCWSQRPERPGWGGMLRDLCCLMSVGVGLCVNNSMAVLEACWGRKTDFVRTPKLLSEGKSAAPARAGYRSRVSALVVLEACGALYFAFVLAYALRKGIYVSVPFVMLFFSGYLLSATLSLRAALLPRRGESVRGWEKPCRAPEMSR